MMHFPFLKKKSFGIDLGNNNTLVSDEDGVLIDQPSYIVLDELHSSVKAVGSEAYDMFEKTHANLKPVKPLRGGVIADQTSAAKMLSALMKKAHSKSFLNRYENIIAGVPFSTTPVEQRALKTALEQFNASHVYLLYEPLAAALGLGLDIQEPNGKMVVDLGGGITEIVIVSLSGVASSQSVKVAGDTMDEEIQSYFRRTYNISIGLKTAEQVKIHAGSALEKPNKASETFMVKGKDLMRGIPTTIKTDSTEIARVLDKSLSVIERSIVQTLEKCPPELAADIFENGIYITGGNSLLRGLQERLEKTVRLKIHMDPYPLHSVSRGVARALREPQKFRALLFQ